MVQTVREPNRVSPWTIVAVIVVAVVVALLVVLAFARQ
jgi:hypothetical protein